MTSRLASLCLCSFAIAVGLSSAANSPAQAPAAPVFFEPAGAPQSDGLSYIARWGARTMRLSPTQATMLVAPPDSVSLAARERDFSTVGVSQPAKHSWIVMDLEGANSGARFEPRGLLESRTHYFLGTSEPRSAPNFQSLLARSVYPGIDLVYHGEKGAVERDFVVAPGADYRTIRMRYSGVDPLRVDAEGNLVLEAGGARVLERKPIVYQDKPSGRVYIPGSFQILSADTAGFQVGAYDRSLPLVIDPFSVRSVGYLGGTGNDNGFSLAVDPDGNIYIGGRANSPDFPGTPLAGTGAAPNAFITKLTPNAQSVAYTTVIGGNGDDFIYGIDVDADGNVFATGSTTSMNFPLQAPFQGTFGGGNADGFVLGLNPAGNSLLFSTYSGGNGSDVLYGIDHDPHSGLIGVCGGVSSTNIPMPAGAIQPTQAGVVDHFFATYSRTGLRPRATLLGGTGQDVCRKIIIQDNVVHFAGTATQTFPVTADALQSDARGPSDFVFGWMNLDLTTNLYTTRFGGDGAEDLFSAKLTPRKELVLTGRATSVNRFPTRSGKTLTFKGGTNDAVVAVIGLRNTAPKAQVLDSWNLGGAADETIYTALLHVAPGGGLFGMRAFGRTTSAFASNIPGAGDCDQTGELAVWDLGRGSAATYQGCLGTTGFPGDTSWPEPHPWAADNEHHGVNMPQILLADVGPFPTVPTNQVFDPTHNGGTDAAVFNLNGEYNSPSTWDGRIGIERVDFEFDGVSFGNTEIGNFWINTEGITGDPFFLNVKSGPDWIVVNLHIDPENQLGQYGTKIWFRGPDSSLLLPVQITQSVVPVTVFDSSAPVVSLPVTTAFENSQCEGAVTAPPQHPEIPTMTGGETWAHVLPFTYRSFSNVEAAANQCAPMGYANSLQYLSLLHKDFALPHRHVPGLEGDQSLVGQLGTSGGRESSSRDKGKGLFGQQQLTGKFAYLDANDLDGKLVHKYQGPLTGASGNTTANFTASGITAVNEGANVTFDWLCGQIKAGEDVEAAYEWNTGAHLVRIFGCGKVLGLPYVMYLHDATQSYREKDAQGNPTGPIKGDDTGLRWERAWVYGNGPRPYWNNTSTTLRTAISESLTDDLKRKPGAVPTTSRDGVTNGASFLPNSLAPGSAGSVFGGMPTIGPLISAASQAPGEEVIRAALPTELGATRVLLNGRAVPLFVVTPTQINFQVPPDLPAGPQTMVIEQSSGRSASFTIDISETAPGIFLIDRDRGAIQNQDFTLHTPANAAKAGMALFVYMTGLGKTDVVVPAGEPAPTDRFANALASVTATVGGSSASVLFAGLTPGFVGLAQVNIVLPNLPPGEYPLIVTVGGKASNRVLVNIAP